MNKFQIAVEMVDLYWEVFTDGLSGEELKAVDRTKVSMMELRQWLVDMAEEEE